MSLFALILYHIGALWLIQFILLPLYRGFISFIWPLIRGPVDLAKTYGSWAVITGSTDGIGLAYAREFARQKLNVVLISRSLEKLQTVAKTIEHDFGVKTKIIAVDFRDGDEIYDKIEEELEKISIGILVNNVVHTDVFCEFETRNKKTLNDSIRVNICSLIFLTKIVLPRMKEKRKGLIINVSSLSENIPLPYGSPYSASKAYMKNFTDALRFENRNYGLDFQLVSPLGVKTKILKFFGKHTFRLPNAEDFIKSAIKTIGYEKHTMGVPEHSLAAYFLKFLPQSFNMWFIVYLLRKGGVHYSKVNKTNKHVE